MNLSLLVPSAPLLTGALLLLVLLGLQARAAGQADPTVPALLDKIDAWRGTAKTKLPASLTIEGTYAVTFAGAATAEPVVKGAFREAFVGDELARHTSEMGAFGSLERGIRNQLVWEVDPSMGAKVHSGANAAVVRRYFSLLRGVSPRDLYREFALAGTLELDGREHTALRMVPAEGKPETWYLDADGTVARIDMTLPTPESADATFDLDDGLPSQLTFSDYRLVEGVRYPHRRKLVMGSATVSFVCTKIEAGAKLDVARFVPPEAITKLKPAQTTAAVGSDGKPTYQVIEREAQAVASIRIKCKPDEISTQLAQLLPEVMAHLTATGGVMAGAPFSRYHAWGDTLDVEAGIPVRAPITEKGRIKNSTLPAGRTVTCWHVGPYHELGKAHEALQAHMTKEKLTSRGGPWEVYWTDPGMVPDPAKWRTQIFAPIE